MFFVEDFYTTSQNPLYSKITDKDDEPFHNHGFYELFYVVDGSITHQGKDGKEDITIGDMYLLRPSDAHSFLRNPETFCRHRDVIVRPAFFEEVCSFLSPDFLENIQQGKITSKIRLQSYKVEEFEAVFKKLTVLSNSKDAQTISYAKSILIELLSCYLKLDMDKSHAPVPVWVNEIIQRFEDPAYLNMGLEKILEPVYYSREHVSKTFHKYMGKTLSDYLTERRLTIAANNLLSSNDTVLSICNSLGISSVSYFNRIFKNRYHCSPSQFRKKYSRYRSK